MLRTCTNGIGLALVVDEELVVEGTRRRVDDFSLENS
jgi:hypothetical protein